MRTISKRNFSRELIEWGPGYRLFNLGVISILLALAAASGYFYLENQRLEEQLGKATRGSMILDAEVPDPVIKYAPLLVSSGDARIKELALSLGGPEAIYVFVRDKIEYSEMYDQRRTASEVLASGQGDCLGKADLLAGLLLAYGYAANEVSVSLGYVDHNGEKRHHAWVEFFSKGKWYVLDPSQFIGNFEFNRWDRTEFYQTYQAEPYARFNDKYVHLNIDGQDMH